MNERYFASYNADDISIYYVYFVSYIINFILLHLSDSTVLIFCAQQK